MSGSEAIYVLVLKLERLARTCLELMLRLRNMLFRNFQPLPWQ
jgi:hypothetical protein